MQWAIKKILSLVIKAQHGEVNCILGFAAAFCLMLSWRDAIIMEVLEVAEL